MSRNRRKVTDTFSKCCYCKEYTKLTYRDTPMCPTCFIDFCNWNSSGVATKARDRYYRLARIRLFGDKVITGMNNKVRQGIVGIGR